MKINNINQVNFKNAFAQFSNINQNNITQSPVVQNNIIQTKVTHKDKKEDFFRKNKFPLAAVTTLAVGGLIYILSRGHNKTNNTKNLQQTIVNEDSNIKTRLNIFGKQIKETIQKNSEGLIEFKEIECEGNKYFAHYNEGKLIDVDEFVPLTKDLQQDVKFSDFLKILSDEEKSQMIITKDWGESKSFYIIDKDFNATEIKEFKTDPEAMYQYGNCKLNSDNTKAYDYSEPYSIKDNIPFAEIIEYFV